MLPFEQHSSSAVAASVQARIAACLQTAQTHLLLGPDQVEGLRRPHGVREGDVGRHGGAHKALAGAADAVNGAAGRSPVKRSRVSIP